MKSGEFSGIGLGGALMVLATLLAACGAADEESQVLNLSIVTAPGVVKFDCFGPGSKDIGGTRTIGTGRTRVVLDLKPGAYTYLCSTGGYWRTAHGTLVVR